MYSQCPICGASYPYGASICPRDGARLVVYAPSQVRIPQQRSTPERSSTVLIAVLAGGLAVLAGLLGVHWMQSRNPSNPVANTAPRSSEFTSNEEPSSPLDEAPATFDASPSRLPPTASALPVPEPPAGTLQPTGPPEHTRPHSSAQFGPARVITDGVGLLLRSGPDPSYYPIGKMLNGDVVTVNGCTSGSPGRRWCEVVYGGMHGFAHDEFLRIGDPSYDSESGLEQAFAASRLVNQSTFVDGSKVSYVNLRERPTVDADVTLRMQPGTSVHVQRCLAKGWSLGGRAIAGSWCFVTATPNGQSVSGWASDDALFW